MCFLVIHAFKRDTNVTLQPPGDTTCQLMLPSLKKPCSSPNESPTLHKQVLPIPYLGPVVPSTHTTSNQGEIQPISPISHQAKLSPSSISTFQRRTQRASSIVQEDSLDSCPFSSANPTRNPFPSSLSLDVDSGWPIALQKRYSIYSKPSSNLLELPPFVSFIFLLLFPLSSITIPKNVYEALTLPGWRQAMIVEMQALEHSGTWELVPLPPRKKAVGCQWVYAVKVGPNGEIDRLKARW